MAWNEPGSGGQGGKDPWGGRNDQTPPDLDEILRRLRQRLQGAFGGRRGGGPRGGSSSGAGWPLFLGVLVVALVVWLLSGIFIVDEGRRGVVLRFGQYVETAMPGPHWHWPYPIGRVEEVDVERRRYIEIGYRSADGRTEGVPVPREALMLTKDENIVDLQLAVQYQVKDARDYLFNVRDPNETLKDVVESALREVVGKSTMDFVLTEGRSEVVARTEALSQQVLNDYNTGLQITSINLQDAQPPEEVQPAFADAIKAREDEQRFINEAYAYANGVIPEARGDAARRIEEARGYRESVIARAEGEVSRFAQILDEYREAPAVTRQRLYLDAIETVLNRSSKALVESGEGNKLLYLPLDRMMQRGAGQQDGEPAAERPPVARLPEPAPRVEYDTRGRENLRSREVR